MWRHWILIPSQACSWTPLGSFLRSKACALEKDQQTMAHGLIYLYIYIYINFFKLIYLAVLGLSCGIGI